MEILRFLLYPFAWIYGFIVSVRNKLFDWKIIRPASFPIPVITVGNLVMGGSGKTPAVEYIVRLLKEDCKVATLSRGYKRKSKGFHLVTPGDSQEMAGDEPLQIARKFNDVVVAVDENRKHGITKLMEDIPGLGVIILDDAYQHRYVKPGLSILVTDYHKIYAKDHLVPVGRLRERRKGSRRADIILVTKTPKIFSPLVRRQLAEDLKPQKDQLLCFSYLSYENWLPLFPSSAPPEEEQKKVNTILMVTGIAFPSPLEEYLRPFCSSLSMIQFPDHHNYSEKDLQMIRDKFLSLPTRKKILVTTEKDAMRLSGSLAESILGDLPVYYVPVAMQVHQNDRALFQEAILSYVKKQNNNS